jgi:photosystem II stability/assembly factor-like uncharacterized protein
MKTAKCILLLLFTANFSFAQWETVHCIDNTFLPTINSIYFTDYNYGIAATGSAFYGQILRTLNQGSTWDTIYNSKGYIDTIHFVKTICYNRDTIIAVGKNPYSPSNTGAIIRTSNGGTSWTITKIPHRLYSICKAGSKTCYCAGWNGTILKSIDAGLNWNTLNSTVANNLNSIFFINDSVGFAGGDSVILKTTDGGMNWSKTYFQLGQYSYVSSVFFPSKKHGYALVFDTGYVIMHTTDLGMTWKLTASVPSNGLYLLDMFFTNDSTGYIAGQFIMNKTINYGRTWQTQQATDPCTGFWDGLMSVYFLNNDTGFAAGWQQFYRTTNGGKLTGIKELSTQTGLSIYPNPSNGALTVNFSNENNSTVKFSVYNIFGQLIQSVDLIKQEEIVSHTFDLSQLSTGLYFVHVQTGSENLQSLSKRFIRE